MKIIYFILYFFIAVFCWAQESSGGMPMTYNSYLKNNFEPLKNTQNRAGNSISTYVLPLINNWKEKTRADSISFSQCATCKSNYYGRIVPVDLDLLSVSSVQYLGDSSKIYLIKIVSDSALGFQFYFDGFKLPIGSKLFIYNSEQTMAIGGFDEKNNRDDLRFGTQNINGDTVYIEYFEPYMAQATPVLHINSIVHIYKSFFDKSGPYAVGNGAESCEVNISCPVGSDWNLEASSVAVILKPDLQSQLMGTCSGALLNNTAQDSHPYFLTANHCVPTGQSAQIEVQSWIFLFNYFDPNCNGNGSMVTSTLTQSIFGATLLSNDVLANSSDYLLLDLTYGTTSYSIFSNWNVCFSGWDMGYSSAAPSPPYVGIHHPEGDVKKISIGGNQAAISTYLGNPFSGFDHWRLVWTSGVTEPGSSGSPLFSGAHRVIGQLHGGTSDCATPNNPDYYGVFNTSWNNGHFQQYLDPLLSNVSSLDTYCPLTATLTNSGGGGGGGSNSGIYDGDHTPDQYLDLNGRFFGSYVAQATNNSSDYTNNFVMCPSEIPTFYLSDFIVHTFSNGSQQRFYSYFGEEPILVSCSQPHVSCSCITNCRQIRQKYWLSVYYGCDEYFNCTSELGNWFYDIIYTNGYQEPPTTIDVGSKLGFQFVPGNYYRIKLATVIADQIDGSPYPEQIQNYLGHTNLGWNEGSMFIYIANYNEDLSNQTLLSKNYIAASHIKMLNSLINAPENVTTEAGVEIHMLPNTEIKSGSTYHGFINTSLPCYDGHKIRNISDSTKKTNNMVKLFYSSNKFDMSSESQPLLSKIITDPGSRKYERSVELYPNPTSEKCFINYSAYPEEAISINIYNSLGLKIQTLFENKIHKKGSYITTIELTNIYPGIYFVDIRSNLSASLLKLNVVK